MFLFDMLYYLYCSSSSHTWDAFHLAHASFSLYCVRNDLVLPDTSQETNGNLGPHLIGEPPKIDVAPVEMVEGDDEEGSPGALPAIKIYDDDVNIRFLICGMTSSLVIQTSNNHVSSFCVFFQRYFVDYFG